MRIAKVFNNSVVLGVDEHDHEFVLFGRGVGFQASKGDYVDSSLVERRFVPSANASAERIVAFIDEIPAPDIDLTARIVDAGREVLGEHVSDHVLIPLADHISFALRRARSGSALEDYPLKWEVESLYPREVEFARAALVMVAEATGVELPDIEAVPLALHFVNAQFGARDIAATLGMTEELAHLLGMVREQFGAAVKPDDPAVARFVTHLRFLYARGRSGLRSDAAASASLGAAVKEAQPREYECARGMADYLSKRYGWDFGESEVLYLAIHVVRLTSALENPAATP